MEELLHERVREYVRKSENTGSFPMTIAVDEERGISNSVNGAKQERALLTDWANEIERYYIPRPHFEDGEPVQFGDEIESPEDGETCIVNSIHVFSDGCYCLSLKGPHKSAHYGSGELVKRPAQKVLDADGIPINNDDTVWHIKGGSKFTVLSIDRNFDGDPVIQTNDGRYIPDQLTHEQPVFDTDGMRICKGDTVWHVGGNNPWRVIEIDRDAKDVTIEDTISSHDTATFKASILTHREPDSLEKLRDRMTDKWNRAFAEHEPITEGELHSFIDDITALIERGER